MIKLKSEDEILQISQQADEIVDEADDQEFDKLVRTYSKVFEVDEKKEFGDILASIDSKKDIKISSSNADLLKIPDRGVKPLRLIEVSGGKIVLSKGSITNFKGDAIVNAANEACLGGGGVDGIISDAGGEALYKAREALPLKKIKSKTRKDGFRYVRCPVGEARLTIGGDLKSKYCIHAVGPNYAWCEAEEGHRLLRSAYKSVMQIVDKTEGINIVGFCFISGGVFRGRQSRDSIFALGIDTIKKTIKPGQEIHFIAYDDINVGTLLELVPLEEEVEKKDELI